MILSNIEIISGLIGFAVLLFNTKFIFKAERCLNFEMETCPFCYNQSSCEFIPDLNVESSISEYLLGAINKKFVFYGYYKNEFVVIKRLADRNEVSKLDSVILNLPMDRANNVDGFQSSLKGIDFYDKSLSLLNQSFTNAGYKLRLCPSLKNAHVLFNPIIERNRGNEFLFMNIWSSLHLNPEPVMLQVFNFEDGWPVPKYFGSCGRIALVENCGKAIHNYLNAPWLFRVHIVEQLLSMASIFTFKDANFGIYLRDISADNIAVDRNMRVRVVDLEHIIIVDKNTPLEVQPKTWRLEHRSEHYDCENCLTYSPMEICAHHISDHNFYAVCKEFLNSIYPKDLGLLHSASDSNFEKLKYYAEECIHPSKNSSRFKIVDELKIYLAQIKIAGNFTLKEYKKLI